MVGVDQVSKLVTAKSLASQLRLNPLDDDGYICVYDDIDKDMLYRTNFAADKNPDGTWTIENVP